MFIKFVSSVTIKLLKWSRELQHNVAVFELTWRMDDKKKKKNRLYTLFWPTVKYNKDVSKSNTQVLK